MLVPEKRGSIRTLPGRELELVDRNRKEGIWEENYWASIYIVGWLSPGMGVAARDSASNNANHQIEKK